MTQSVHNFAKPLAVNDPASYMEPHFIAESVAQLEVNLGIGYFISKEDEPNPHGACNCYTAKVSFYLDTSQMEITVITIQGQRLYKVLKDHPPRLSP